MIFFFFNFISGGYYIYFFFQLNFIFLTPPLISKQIMNYYQATVLRLFYHNALF